MDTPDTSLTASAVAWQLELHGEPYSSMDELMAMRVNGCPPIKPDTPAYKATLTPDECNQLTQGMAQRYAPRRNNIPVVIVEWNGRHLIDGRNRCCLAHREGLSINAVVICPA